MLLGNATRVCAMNGMWLDPDVSTCLGVTFAVAQEVGNILMQILKLLGQAVMKLFRVHF